MISPTRPRAYSWEAPRTARELLNAVRRLHIPDPTTPQACTCGLSHPCPTTRELEKR